MRDQGDRAAILQRRSFFIASAVAGLALPSACTDGRRDRSADEGAEFSVDEVATGSPSASGDPPLAAPQMDEILCLRIAVPLPPSAEPAPTAPWPPRSRPPPGLYRPAVCLNFEATPPPDPSKK